MSTTTSPTALSSIDSKSSGRARLWLKRGSFGLAVIVAGLAGLGAVYQLVTTRQDAQRYPPPGEMVDAGGYRLHLLVAGATHSAPTVILDAGLGIPSTFLANLQKQVAPFAQVVSYDRPGIGWSDSLPAGQTHDALTNARALHAALINAGIPGPYVLVGHSAGGLNMLVFADTYLQDTAGIVLIDSTHPDQFLRYPPKLAQGKRTIRNLSVMMSWGARLGILRFFNLPKMFEAEALEADQQAALQAQLAASRFGSSILAEMGAWELTFPQVRAIKSLGATPLVVLTAGTTAEQVPVQVEMHQEYAALSTNSRQEIVAGASHGGLAISPQYLPVVTDAIRQVLESARTGQPLVEK